MEATTAAYRTDPDSAFGGIIAFNRELDEETAAAIVDRQISPKWSSPGSTRGRGGGLGAKKNVRLLVSGAWREAPAARQDWRKVTGGSSSRTPTRRSSTSSEVVTQRAPSGRGAQTCSSPGRWRSS